MSDQSNSGNSRILAIETSTRSGSVALAEVSEQELQFVAKRELPTSQRAARALLSELQDLLKQSSWKLTDVSLVAVTTGPGSFTGLRIGVTAAKSIAYATGAKLVGVPTLVAMAYPLPQDQQPVWTILDAQREELFAARHPPGWQDRPEIPVETLVVGIEQWLSKLQPAEVVAGPLIDKLRDRLPQGVIVADRAYWSPKASAVARLGWEFMRRGKAIDPFQLVPHYYRKSAAEEKVEAK